MDIITRLEEAVLIAIWKLKDAAYGVAINRAVSSMVNKQYSMGALYFSLDQLFRKELVTKKLINLYNEKGGRSRTYYTLTPQGREALQQARVYQESLWNDIPAAVFDTGETD